MNVYIDIGCYDGDTVREFRNWGKMLHDDWEIYAFDPNPRFQAKWNKMTNEHTHFERKAAHNYNGEVDFTLRPVNAPYGSTIMREKRDWGMGEVLTAKCFDFSQWIKRFADDFVIVKFDAEGAEFPILNKMIDDGTYNIMDIALIEWHDGKMTGEYNRGEIINTLGKRYKQWL